MFFKEGIRNFLKAKRLSISAKFSILTILLITAASAGVALFLTIKEIKSEREALLYHGISFAQLLANNSEYAIYTEEQRSLQELVSSIESDNNISYVFVLDKGKKVIQYKSRNNHVRMPPNVHYEQREHIESRVLYGAFRDPDGKSYIDIRIPVTSLPRDKENDLFIDVSREPVARTIGYIQLGYSLEELNAEIRQFILVTIAVTFVLIVIGIVITMYLTARIASPVKELARAAQGISRGDYDHHIDIGTNDEISDLSRSFNNMLIHLRTYRGQVEERTDELSSANKRMLEEITERKRAEKSLYSTKERLQHLLTCTPAAIYSCRPYGDFVINYVSENVKTLTGYESEEFLQNARLRNELIHEDDLVRFFADFPHVFKTGNYSFEYRFKHKDGHYIWIFDEMRLVRDVEGNPSEIIGYWIDISKRKILEEKLQHDALHDSLTGLPNRALFEDRLEFFMARMKRHNDCNFNILFLDIDRFKNINDSLGHFVGDVLLIEVALRLKNCIHAEDTVARLGGDEFAILLEDIKTREDVTMIVERIHSQMNIPFEIEGHEIFISASIGIVLNTREYTEPEQIMRDADTAMYNAKALGGSCHVIFDADMHAHVVARLKIENDLRRALERNELSIHYQPIGLVETGKIVGFEALLRWRHPEYGYISPAEFIPIAEETGLIIPIGDWVISEACRQMSIWQERFPSTPPLTISINLSAKQFSLRIMEQIKDVLRNTNLEIGSLKLEITESVLIEKPDIVEKILLLLREMNVQVFIDDFGTGYSSLSYLQKLHVFALKIDRTFIGRIDTDDSSLELVETIKTLAHNLNLFVVAEGVETAAQLDHLRKMQCDYVQGYLLSKPLDSDSVETLLATQNQIIQI